MRKKYFLAILAAVAISMSLAAPVAVYATEAEDTSDIIDDEQAEGEQITIAAPEADSDSTDNNSSASSNSSSSGSNSNGSAGSNSSSSSSSSNGSAGSNSSSSGSNSNSSASSNSSSSGSNSNSSAGSNSSSSSSNSNSSSAANSGNTANSTRSADSSLAHLGISPGSLSPAFSAGTHEYSATLEAGVSSISVAARPNNSGAVIASVSGAKSLKPGMNTVKVVVEAENGTTTTYTINVTCGSASESTQTAEPDTPVEELAAEDDGAQSLEGEISTIDDTKQETGEQAEITFDENGYLIYEGNAYLPSSMMPEGDYVSLDKYNRLYEQQQTQKTKSMRILIVLIVAIALLLIVILNLVLKLRDMRQDARLGLNGLDDDEPEKRQKAREPKTHKEAKARSGKAVHTPEIQTDTSMIPDVKMPEAVREEKISKPVRDTRVESPAKPPKSEKPQKAAASKPAKPVKTAKSSKKDEDLEILDLNDL